MKCKKVVIFILASVFLFIGCKNGKSENILKSPLDLIKQEFVKSGFEVGENQELFYQMIGATSGYKFDLNGEPVEIYFYDEKNLSDEGKVYFEQAKNGSVDISGFTIPVTLKNNLVIARANDHKDKEKILEVFNNFKY